MICQEPKFLYLFLCDYLFNRKLLWLYCIFSRDGLKAPVECITRIGFKCMCAERSHSAPAWDIKLQLNSDLVLMPMPGKPTCTVHFLHL